MLTRPVADGVAENQTQVLEHPCLLRAIDKALVLVRKECGQSGKLAEVLLDMRGVPLPCRYQDRQALLRYVRSVSVLVIDAPI